MPITAKQRQRRRNYIGASDVSAIMGMNPYDSAIDVWASKVYEMEPLKKKALDYGNALEPLAIQHAVDALGWTHHRKNQLRVAPDLDSRGKHWLSATLDDQKCDIRDGTLVFLPEAIEAKYAGDPSQWGEGNDEIPDHIIIQCQTQIHCANLDRVYVSVETPGYVGLENRMYTIERNDRLITAIRTVCRDFWEKHVLTGIRPDYMTQTARPETYKRIIRKPGSYGYIKQELVDQYEAAKTAEKEAKEAAEAAKSRLIMSLGKDEGAITDDCREVWYVPNKNGSRRLVIKGDKAENAA